MIRPFRLNPTAFRFALPALLLCLGLWGCGGKEEPATEESPVAETAQNAEQVAAAPAATPAGALPALPAGTPGVVDVLRLMPASAQVAIGLPSIQTLQDGAVPLARKVVPAEADIDTALEQWVAELGQQVGAPEAKSLGDLALSLGVDPTGPMAMFGDFSPVADEAVRMADQYASFEAEKAAENAPAPEDAPADTPEQPEDAPGVEEAPAPAEEPAFEGKFEAEPNVVAVLTIADREKAKARIEEQVAKDESLDKVAEEIQVDGITIYSHDAEKFSYFFVDNKLVLARKLAMLQETAARVKDPQALRYGSAELPANGDGEIAVFVFGQRVLPLLERVEPAVAKLKGAAAVSQAQLASARKMFETNGEDDPWFYGMSWTEKSLQFTGRADTKTHPGLLATTGVPHPLRLAQLMPENTLGLLTFQLTPEMKQQLTDVYLSNTAAFGDQMVMGAAIAKQVVSSLKDEVLVGVSGVANDFPGIFIMATLATPEATRGMMNMFVPTQPGELYREVQIEDVAAPGAPFPVSMIMLDDLLIVSNNVDGLKKIIDLQKDNQTSGYLSQLNPPLDPTAPRFSAFVLDTRLLSDFVLPLSTQLMGGLGGEADATVNTVAGTVDQIRAVNEIRGDWVVSEFQVQLKEQPAAPATAEAPLEGAAPGGSQ